MLTSSFLNSSSAVCTSIAPIKSRKRHNFKPSASYEELISVLAFSAFPFLAVKAIANSSLGENLQKKLESKKVDIASRVDAIRAAQEDAKKKSPWYGDSRPKWLGPIPFDYPSHLSGEISGDYGYDPLGLGRDPSQLARLYNFEILHGRWAMLSALGAIVPEALVRYAGVNFSEPIWWKVGYAKLQGDTLDYLGIPGLHVAGAQGVIIIAIAQVFLMVGPEYARFTGIEALEPLGIFLPGDINYPGGLLFDPLGLSNDPASFTELKVKEIKNARLAMVAWLGFAVQAIVTGKGPLENLLDFISNPSHNNIASHFL